MNGMRPTDEEILNRWLAAEQNGEDEAAEMELLALFEALPPLAPPAGFADRVLARAGMPERTAPAVARWNPFAARWLQVAVALCLVVTGATLPWLTEILQSLASTTSLVLGPGDLVRLGTGALNAVTRGLVAAFALWDWFLEIGRTLTEPLVTPVIAVGMIACLLVSLVAFHYLRDLITRDRSWTHVDV
jgi:hypothetical protein